MFFKGWFGIKSGVQFLDSLFFFLCGRGAAVPVLLEDSSQVAAGFSLFLLAASMGAVPLLRLLCFSFGFCCLQCSCGPWAGFRLQVASFLPKRRNALVDRC